MKMTLHSRAGNSAHFACPHGGPVHRMTHNSNPVLLNVAPNPARNAVNVTFSYGSDAKDAARSLELYDVVGRRLASYNVAGQAEGVWYLSLSNIAAGTYQVVMKERGSVLATVRLSVSR